MCAFQGQKGVMIVLAEMTLEMKLSALRTVCAAVSALCGAVTVIVVVTR